MSKKHHKKQNRQGFRDGYGQPWQGEGFGPAQAPFGYAQQQARYAYGQGQGQYDPQAGFAPDIGMPRQERGHGYDHHDDEAYGPGNFDPGVGAAYAYGGGSRQTGRGYGPGGFESGPGAGNYAPGGVNRDFLREMSSLFPSQHTDQFLLGLLIGAGAAWVMSDDEIRGKLIKSVMKVYAGVAGGFEELKEQMADIKAEVAAERHGDE
ncbi:YtxH domain-containing protein [Methylomonas rivi]|uniref:YtxH domain-containing protein n=1 Tax=Methylomonas rivi TaxID=2952226 RepID=A0ABT1UB15_9GAMM|nr:YtxH domain-containing protein [Methylomonas sp. WSC-6]MCQ8131055.1 YtxH domain-containing protein [Methylomonas sp. WSC-6]